MKLELESYLVPCFIVLTDSNQPLRKYYSSRGCHTVWCAMYLCQKQTVPHPELSAHRVMRGVGRREADRPLHEISVCVVRGKSNYLANLFNIQKLFNQ